MTEIEKKIIDCIIQNIGMSGEKIPDITGETVLLRDIDGFDSLRTLEVLTELGADLDLEIPLEIAFSNSDHQSLDISGMARNIKKLMENKR